LNFAGKYHGQAGGLETGGSSDFDSGECVCMCAHMQAISKFKYSEIYVCVWCIQTVYGVNAR